MSVGSRIYGGAKSCAMAIPRITFQPRASPYMTLDQTTVGYVNRMKGRRKVLNKSTLGSPPDHGLRLWTYVFFRIGVLDEVDPGGTADSVISVTSSLLVSFRLIWLVTFSFSPCAIPGGRICGLMPVNLVSGIAKTKVIWLKNTEIAITKKAHRTLRD